MKEDLFIARLETFLRNSKPVARAVHFARTQHLIGAVVTPGRSNRRKDFEQFRQQVEQYFSSAAGQRTDDQAVARPPRPVATFWDLVLCFLFFRATVHNFLPAFIPVGLAGG